jgi:uncharacterized membrane protein
MKKGSVANWRANFFAGLAIVLPVAISIAVFAWLFGSITRFTDNLLFFLPDWLKYADPVRRDIHWYWSLLSLLLAIVLIAVVGRSARNYVGKKVIQLVDKVLMRVPLLNKIYGAIKQVNEAFTSSNKSSFKHVVLVEFPRPGIYSVGFITGENHAEVQAKTRENIVSVFIPTTPNPTSGYLALVPASKVIRLEMPVADGIKFIISLGSVAPPYPPLPADPPPLEIQQALVEMRKEQFEQLGTKP